MSADSNEREFEGTVEASGVRAFIRLPFRPDEAWGARDRHHITGTVGGVKIRGPLAMEGDAITLPLLPAWLRDNPLAPGSTVLVLLRPEGPQLSALDEDITAALEANPAAKAFFESLPTFYRKAYLTWLAGAKRRPDVRTARLVEFVEHLLAGRKERPKA